MNLFAERFVRAGGRFVDLATGEPVAVVRAGDGEPSAIARWAVRCDTLYHLRHPSLAPLVDYGVLGTAERFEAWRCDSSWTGASRAAARVLQEGTRFLRSCGLSCSPPDRQQVYEWRGCPVLVPDRDSGHTAAALDAPPELAIPPGIARLPRRPLAAVADALKHAVGCRPYILATWGPPGAGTDTLASDLARLARLEGFVPVDVRMFAMAAAAIANRTLFLIAGDADEAWAVLLRAALRAAKPHVLLLIGEDEVSGVHGLPLERLPPDALEAAIRPVGLKTEAVARAARRSEGWPGRFARLLWAPQRRMAERSYAIRPSFSRVAEEARSYGEAIVHRAPPAQATAGWPAPAELASIRRRLELAERQLREGRHAPGERTMRQLLGALSRRGDWAYAGRAAIALASALVRRGRAREAQPFLAQAEEWLGRLGKTNDAASGLEIAVLSGIVWLELARLDEAESVLGAAAAAARGRQDGPGEGSAVLALARVFFWRGQYAEALNLVAPLSARARPSRGAGDPRVAVRTAALAARAAVGARDFVRGMGEAAAATESAETLGDQEAAADAWTASAFVHLAVGDLSAVDRDARAAIGAARRAHHPLWALRARLLQAEGHRRAGRRAAAAAIVRRFSRLEPLCTPPILRARVNLLADCLSSAAAAGTVATRHAKQTGLAALTLFVPPSEGARPADETDPAVAELIAILHACQAAEEETVVLAEVCGRVRRRLRAAGAVVAGRLASGAAVNVGDGARVDLDLVERATASGAIIHPQQRGDRIEAAAPVRCGGATIGAIAVRWPLGTPHDLSMTSALLSMAAAAVASTVSTALARQSRPASPVGHELLGAGPVMAAVRRAVNRAASAPFAVLVQGESGSGKELVARALHRGSSRRDRPFRTLNCAALPDDLVEAELFGHARGAFTGAIAERTGVFEDAHGGALFLDEVGELAPRAQAKLLRVLQEGEIRRVGENVPRRVDVRIISATNRDLAAEAAAGRFRQDLLYRLDVVRIELPPLRERREDIPVLVEHFWREAAERLGSRATLAAAAVAALARYDWPGNVRELQNVLAALAVRSPRRGVVPATALPGAFGPSSAAGLPGPPDAWRLDAARRTFEERFVRAALVRAGGQRARAAEELGVTRQGLAKLLARLGIEDA